MSIQQIVQQLQSQHTHHLNQAARLRRAIEELSALFGVKAPAGRAFTKVMKAQNGQAKALPGTKRRSGKLTLSQAIAYVLGERQKAGVAGATARQLMDGLSQAGYKFGSKNAQNNMNYLYKTLRRNKQFKRAGDGLFALG